MVSDKNDEAIWNALDAVNMTVMNNSVNIEENAWKIDQGNTNKNKTKDWALVQNAA